jgi:NAD(P)-dependent dehydrogenase (short-subunit alcohol dehydrogenase family)
MFDLTGRAVVVTGGGRGIGLGIVRAMARAGADVVVTGRTVAAIEAAAEEARALGVTAHAWAADVTVPEDVASVVARTVEEFGRIHCWVNNAGSARPEDVGPLIDLTEHQWDAVVDLNLKWTFFAAQAAARAMATSGGGSIINISSRSGSYPCPNTGHYGAAKAAIDNLTATMAAEWGHLGIRVNAVAPGVVITEASEGRMTESRRRRQVESVPLQRLGTPDDIGPVCVYLASDESAWQTGTVTHINGGSPIPVGYLTYLHHVNAQT